MTALLDEGDLATARIHFEAAARAALAGGDAPGLGRAALGLSGLWVHEHRTAIEAARIEAWQERALTKLAPTDPLAMRLRIRLSAERDYRAGVTVGILDALKQARAQSDPVVLADALSLAHHCMLGPTHGATRLALAEELLSVAGLTGRRVDELLGLLWRTVDLLLAGDPHAERSRRELVDVTSRHGLRAVDFVLAAIEVMSTVRRGDLDTAEQLAGACYARGQQVGDIDAVGWYAAQIVNIRWFQDRLGDLIPMLDELVSSPTLAVPNEALLAALAVAHAQQGDARSATEALRRIRGRHLGELADSSTWLITMSGVIEAAALLGDRELAAEAYRLLLPLGDLPMTASLAVVCFGSAHYSLGRAAQTSEEFDVAAEHFRAAVVADQALGHRLALDLAERRLDEVTSILAARAIRLATATCRREAGEWRVTLGERSVLVAECVGLSYLAQLVSRPGEEVAAVQLAGSTATGTGSAPVLDDDARRAYTDRARQLQSELEDAESIGDLVAAEQAAAELDWLLDEVDRATGLGGRTRRFTDDRERARTSVQKAIRRAFSQIAKSDPNLAAALSARVSTGTYCCYRAP